MMRAPSNDNINSAIEPPIVTGAAINRIMTPPAANCSSAGLSYSCRLDKQPQKRHEFRLINHKW